MNHNFSKKSSFLSVLKIVIKNKNLFKPKTHNKNMNKWLELFIGVIILVIAVYAWGTNFWSLGNSAMIFLKGGIMWLLLGVGFLLIILGISDLKE